MPSVRQSIRLQECTIGELCNLIFSITYVIQEWLVDLGVKWYYPFSLEVGTLHNTIDRSKTHLSSCTYVSSKHKQFSKL